MHGYLTKAICHSIRVKIKIIGYKYIRIQNLYFKYLNNIYILHYIKMSTISSISRLRETVMNTIYVHMKESSEV